MPRANAKGTHELTYSLGTASRLTGISADLLRAWERRYGVVEPIRTPGGTRRYRAADLERLQLVKAAVDAGHRIGHVAQLDVDTLRGHVVPSELDVVGALGELFDAVERLDAMEVRRLLGLRLSALGPVPFAREIAVPLLHEVGERWARGDLGIAAEHLLTAVIRALLGSALAPGAISLLGPRIVFATPVGERHELGLHMAALVALGAGANPVYLGLELPVEDCIDAVERTRASALAMSLVTISARDAGRVLKAVRSALPDEVRLWVGGRRAGDLSLPSGVACPADLEQFEREVTLLGVGGGGRP